MSMSTHVLGVIPPDEKFERMKNAYDACKLAGVPVPENVADFFGGEEPDPKGRLVELGNAREWDPGHPESGFEVWIDELPPHVKAVRFINSW
jgi:hypothetical protein